jgi:hypothetical protein
MAKAGLWTQKAVQLGNNSAQLKQLQSYLQSQSGDYAAIAKDAAAAVSAAEQAGKRPEEGDLLRLADAYQRTNNASGQSAALEKLLAYYSKREYWAAALGRLPRKPGFSDRYALDVLRLRLATGNLSKSDDFMEMAQLALQGGYAAEAKMVVDKGFASGALGTGSEAERHKRLRDLAVKQDAAGRADLDRVISEARDGNALVLAGSLAASFGQSDKGLALIEQGIAKGNLKRPEEAKLRLGLAQLQSGKQKAKAVQTLRTVQGSDGAADIARFWTLVGNAS